MIKERLLRTRELAPKLEPIVHEFAAGLADYLNEDSEPEAFVLAVALLISDLARGVSGYGRQLPPKLLGYPPVLYAALEVSALDIADAVYPPADFARIQTAFHASRGAP